MRSSSTEPVRAARQRGHDPDRRGRQPPSWRPASSGSSAGRLRRVDEPTPAAIASPEPAPPPALSPPPRAPTRPPRHRGADHRGAGHRVDAVARTGGVTGRRTSARALRPNTALPAQISLRREQLGPRVNAALGAAAMDRAPARRSGRPRRARPRPGTRPWRRSPPRRTRRAGPPPRCPSARAAARNPAPAAAAEEILGRGQSAFDRGDYPEALRRGREAIAAGGALRGHLLVGDAYYRLERFPDALREYQAALALDPGEPVDQAAPRPGREGGRRSDAAARTAAAAPTAG